jgi:hypothetical protein
MGGGTTTVYAEKTCRGLKVPSLALQRTVTEGAGVPMVNSKVEGQGLGFPVLACVRGESGSKKTILILVFLPSTGFSAFQRM